MYINMEIRRLFASDYNALLELLNCVFTRQNRYPMQFELELPKMCVADDEHMQKHFGVFEDGKLCAALGVYPLPAVVCGVPLLFSTVGNVATLREYEGRGYMKSLMREAMNELERIGADASRLGGLRGRYNRYGYEDCGSAYNFVFTERNRNSCFPDFENDIKFIRVTKGDTDFLSMILKWQKNEKMYVIRSEKDNYFDVFSTISAWKDQPFMAKNKDGKPIGFISVSGAGNAINELYADSADDLVKIVSQWQYNSGNDLTISFEPYRKEYIRKFSYVCESNFISSPSLFKIINWVKVTNAYMQLKSSLTSLPDGSFVLGIKDYGNILLFCENGKCGCKITDKKADAELDSLSASRFLFGRLPCDYVADGNCFTNAWLPLPLSWNTHDRV